MFAVRPWLGLDLGRAGANLEHDLQCDCKARSGRLLRCRRSKPFPNAQLMLTHVSRQGVWAKTGRSATETSIEPTETNTPR
jgi:hypothetical protein